MYKNVSIGGGGRCQLLSSVCLITFISLQIMLLSIASFREEGRFLCSQSAGMGFGLSCSGSFG